MGEKAASKPPILLVPVHDRSFEQVRVINSAVLPVQYQDRFYRSVISSGQGLSHLAYYSGVLVGAICCRFERMGVEAGSPGAIEITGCTTPDSRRVYIMTLSVLAPYRRLGVGRALLEKVIASAVADERVAEVALHVWQNNTPALAFYRSFGFDQSELIHDYYQRIENPHAYRLTLPIRAGADGARAAVRVDAPAAA